MPRKKSSTAKSSTSKRKQQTAIEVHTQTKTAIGVLVLTIIGLGIVAFGILPITRNSNSDTKIPHTSTRQTISPQYVAVQIDGSTPESDILISKSNTWYPIVTYRMEAVYNEGVQIKDLYFDAIDMNDVITNQVDARVKTLGLFDENGTLLQEKTLQNGQVHFDLGSSSVAIDRNTIKRITVKAQLNPITDGSKTGKILRLRLSDSMGVSNTGIGGIKADSGDDLVAGAIRFTGDRRSDVFTMYKTKPELITMAMPNNQFTNMNLSNGGNKTIYKFAVRANQNGQVSWRGIKFDVTGQFGGAMLHDADNGLIANNMANLSNFKLYVAGTNQEVQNGAYTVKTAIDSVNGNGEVEIVINEGTEEIVAAGSQKQYELRATIAGVSESGDFVSVGIDRQADQIGDATLLGAGFDPDSIDGGTFTRAGDITMLTRVAQIPYVFLWSDNSGAPHKLQNKFAEAVSKDWSNDRLVDIDSTTWSLYSDL